MQTKKQKEAIVKDLAEKLQKTKAAVFADYAGLSVAKMTAFRRQLKTQEAEIKVAKKTLIDLALKKADLPVVETKKMQGQIALVLGYQDEIAPAKASYLFTKGNEHFKILGGILERKFIEATQVLALAKIPSRQELLSQLVGSIAAPMSGIVNVLQGNLRNLVYVLSQIKK